MINDQLLRYIKQQVSLNVSKEVISTNLKSQGWTDGDINEAFSAIPPAVATPVSTPATPATTSTPASPVAPVATPNLAQPVHHESKKMIPVIAILILLVIAGGAVGYAYYTGMFSFKKTETFEQVFSKAMDKVSSQKYTKTKSNVSITLKDEKIITQLKLNTPFGTYPQINFSSDAVLSKEDLNDSSKDKVSINTKFNVINILKDPIFAEVDFLMPEPMIFYVKLSELTGLPEGTSSLSASLFQGKWWKVDIQTLVKNFGGAEADKILESIENNKLSKEKLEKINVIFKKYLSIAQVEKLADGVIEGAPAYHFSVGFDKKQLIDMFMEISEVGTIDSVDEMKIQTPDLKAEIEKVFDMIDIKPFELLIQKRDYVSAQVTFSLVILDKEGKEIADVKMTYTTSSSEPVNIQAPAESTDILYLMGPIVQSSLDSARQKGNEAVIKATLSNMRPQAEIFWDGKGSYSGFCVSQELKDARKYIEEKGGTGFVCKEVAQKYAIGVKISGDSGNWCIDSSGFSKSTATLPSGTVCPLK